MAQGEAGGSRSVSPASSMRSALSRPEEVEGVLVISSDEEELTSPPDKVAILGPLPTGRGIGAPNTLAAAKRDLRIAQARVSRMTGNGGRHDRDGETAISVPLARRVAVKTAAALEVVGDAPTPEVAARALERVDDVIKVSTVSKGLKGSLVAALRRDAAEVRACVATLARRAQPSPEEEGPRRELEAVREELRSSRAEVEDLRFQLGELIKSSSTMRPPPAWPSPGPSSSPSIGGVPRRASSAATSGHGRRKISSNPELGGGDEEMPPLPRERERSPLRREDVLPPEEEWPPAIRPAIKGMRAVLRDPPAEPPRWPKGPVASPPKDLGEVVDLLKVHLESLFRAWVGAQAPQPGRRGEAKAPASISLPPNPPVIGGEEGGRKGKKKRKKGGGDAATPPKGATHAGPPGGKTPLGAAARPTPSPAPSSSRLPLPAVPQPPAQDLTWAKVVGRRERRAEREKLQPRVGGQGSKPLPPTAGRRGAVKATPPTKAGGAKQAKKSPPPGKGPAAGKKKKKRPPTSAAVTITCPEGKYEEVMREARSNIDLATLNIEALRTRRAITGALIFEVAGEGGAAKADALAARLRGVLARREDVRVARPVKMAELRVRDLDDSVRGEEVAAAVAAKGGCDPGEVRVGELKRAPNGLASAWVRCPLAAANKAAAGGRIKVGWAMARLEVLEERPLTCYKCMGRGHVRASCTSEEDRSGLCYRCGQPGHLARSCEARPNCTRCEKAGLSHDHRVGAKACRAPTQKKKKGRTGTGSAAPGPSSANKGDREMGGTADTAVPTPAQPPLREVASRVSGEGGLALPHPAAPEGSAPLFVFSPPISGGEMAMEVDPAGSTEPPKERRLPRVVAVEGVTALVKVVAPEEATGNKL